MTEGGAGRAVSLRSRIEPHPIGPASIGPQRIGPLRIGTRFAFRSHLVILGLAVSLAGCAGMGRLSDQPPPDVNLTGTWKLDPQRSTDAGKALQALVKAGQRGRARSHGEHGGGDGPSGRQGGATGQSGLEGTGSDDALLAGPAIAFPPDISLQKSLLASGEWLKIEQRPDEIVISNAETSRSFVPGERSVVSVPGGVADQRSGWKGREYWIEIKPQVGPSAIEKLKLSPDGKQLIETIDVGSEGRIPRLEVTRVYVPTREAPSALPSED